MSGTKLGGKKAAITNKALHGEDFYARIGRNGGKNGTTGGFFANPALAAVSGAKGGRNSKRGFKLLSKLDGYFIYRNTRTGEVFKEKRND